MGNSRTSLVEKKLDQPASKSKKALYAGMAGLGIVIVFLSACFLILKHSEVSKEIVELSTTSIMGFMALAVTLITGQAAFDWRAVSALQHMDEDTDNHETIQSNQPIGEVDISHGRSPKDFLGDSSF